MRKSTIIIVLSAAIMAAGIITHNPTSIFISIAALIVGLIADVTKAFDIKEEDMENEPIDMVVEMLKESQKEIGTLVKSYESGNMPPAELVARTFEIGKMFMGWQDEMPDDEALALIKEENKQIQAYLNNRKMRS